MSDKPNPDCPKCGMTMALVHINPGPSKSFHRSFECQTCQEALQKVDPFTLNDLADAEVQKWLRSGLHAPT